MIYVKKLLVSSINYNLPKQDITNKATFDLKVDASFDEVGNVLQKLESNIIVDTSSPTLKLAQVQKLVQTDIELELESKIKKLIPEPNVPIVAPIEEPPYTPPSYGGGSGGGGGGSEPEGGGYTNPDGPRSGIENRGPRGRAQR